MSPTQYNTVTLPKSDVKVFYREHGSQNSSVLLLLHGFPSSSHQYRDLIPLLANRYHVIAPDLPGFGFTKTPLGFKHEFVNLATTVNEFLDVLSISSFSIYIFDYGAPTGLRLALQRPNAVKAIITQNGNAYLEGLGDVWAPVRAFWASKNAPEDRAKFSSVMLNLETVKFQYVNGTPDENTIAPESYTLDYALMERPGNKEAQLDLFYDYQTNLAMYEQFQQYFRTSQVPLLAVWGKNDIFFIPAGAAAFQKDLPNARIRMLDAGHFAVESHTAMIADEILDFLKKNKI